MKQAVMVITGIIIALSMCTGVVWAVHDTDTNTWLGLNAGSAGPTGQYNNFIGYYTGHANTSGYENNFIGAYAGSSNSVGGYNNSIGYSAGEQNDGYGNNFIGAWAGNSNTNGHNNTFIGTYAGFENVPGSGNVFMGYSAGSNDLGSNTLYIDNCYLNSGSPDYLFNQPLIYGEFNTRVVQIDGSLTMVTLATPSDVRYKKEVKPLDSSLDKVMHLQGVTFEWDKDKVNGAGYKTGK
jgi:hypothetical protein